jgi:hypothetical protein
VPRGIILTYDILVFEDLVIWVEASAFSEAATRQAGQGSVR